MVSDLHESLQTGSVGALPAGEKSTSAPGTSEEPQHGSSVQSMANAKGSSQCSVVEVILQTWRTV